MFSRREEKKESSLTMAIDSVQERQNDLNWLFVFMGFSTAGGGFGWQTRRI